MNRIWVAAVWALSLGAVRTAAAQAVARPAEIHVARGPAAADCPDAPALAAQVARIRGRDVLDPMPAPGDSPRIDVAFGRSDGSYTADIGFRGAVRTIRDRTRTCAALSDAVAVTLSLLVDAIEDPAPATPAAVEHPVDADAQSLPAVAVTRPAPASTEVTPPDDIPPGLGDEARHHSYARHEPSVPKNALFFELFGTGLMYSVNYERFVGPDGAFSVRVGFAQVPAVIDVLASAGGTSGIDRVEFPVTGSFYVGRRSHRLQLGAGALVNASPGAPPVIPAIVVGYRYLHRPDGFQFGLGATPLLLVGARSAPIKLLPMTGITLGLGF